jgi:P4 family phage/plasmid primase-like protien
MQKGRDVTKHEIRTDVKQNRFLFLLENGFKLIQLKQAKKPVYTDWPNKNHIDGTTDDPDDLSDDPEQPGIDLGTGPESAFEKATKSAKNRLNKRRNVGAILPPGVVVIDIDTRVDPVAGTAGEEQFEALLSAHGGMDFQVFLTSTYSVKTGGGGYHLFFKYDESKHLSASLKRAGCPSVDVLHGVRFVVTPGCGHDSGGVYEQVERSPLEIRPLPQWLADLVFTDIDDLRILEDDGQVDSLRNVVSPAELSTMLAALDPVQYRDYGSWFALLAACHHATGGDPEAMVAFADWSSRDPEYVDEAHRVVEAKWATVHSRRQRSKGLATVRSLLAAVGRTVAEAKAVNKLLGQPEAPALVEALGVSSALRGKLVKDLLQPVAIRSDKEAFLDWVSGLQGRWTSLETEAKRGVFERAAQFDELEWPKIAEAISSASLRELSKKKVEIAIRNEKRRAAKEQKALEKQEKADSELTTPMLVELIAEQSIIKVFGEKGNLGWASNEIIYHYKDGVWAPIERPQVEKAAYNVAFDLVDTKKEKSKTLAQFSSLAADTIRLKTLGVSGNIYSRKSLPNCINLKNGTVWFEPGKPPEFKPHCREDYLTTQLPYDYDPDATSPGICTMLDQVFVEIEREFSIAERDDFKRHFWEVIGYMIQPNKNHPLAWIWIGGGKNGKSRLTKILAKLVGKASWKKGDLRDFNPDKNPHMLHSLENQLVLLDDDAKKGLILDDGMIKKICESSDILVNPKNKDAYMIRLQVTPLILTNHELGVDDLSDGMLRKLQIAEFKANLVPLETSELPDKVEAEQMPGVLNLAIQGLSRLRDRGRFEIPKCALEFKRRYLAKANSMYYFWDSVIKTESPGKSANLKDAYALYKEYVLHNLTGRAVSFPLFCDDLKHCGANIENGKIKDLVLEKPDCWVSP